jgi:hypothetical protein
MIRRKGEDTIATKRRRMPYVAKIRREGPFRPEDAREVEAACRRMAAASESRDRALSCSQSRTKGEPRSARQIASFSADSNYPARAVSTQVSSGKVIPSSSA